MRYDSNQLLCLRPRDTSRCPLICRCQSPGPWDRPWVMGRPARQAQRNKPFEPRHVIGLVGVHALQRLKDRTTSIKGGGCWHCSGDCYLQFKGKECDIIKWRRAFSSLTPERQDVELCQMFYESAPGGLMIQQSSPTHSTVDQLPDLLQGEWENEDGQVDTSGSDDDKIECGTVCTSVDNDDDMDATSLPESACTSSQPSCDQDTTSQSGDSTGAPLRKRAKWTNIGQARRRARCPGQMRRRQWSFRFLGQPVCQPLSSSHTLGKRHLPIPRHNCSSTTCWRWH